MRKRTKMLTSGLISATLSVPSLAFAVGNNENSNINIELEKNSVILGDTSKVSISFKEKQSANNIILNLSCYDEKLSTTLNYNPENNTYEGEIKFDIDPEYLNVWTIENIVVNSDENAQTLDKNKLKELGVNVDDYKITQEYILSNAVAPANYLKKVSAPVEKLAGNTEYDTAVAVSKKGWPNGSKKVVIVNGDIIADGISATPLAATYEAPLLIVKKDTLPQAINEELKRLRPEEIIVVGGVNTISESVYNTIKSNTNAKMSRIWGNDRNETSLRIAEKIDKDHDVNTVFISNGFKGDIDALTIAAKAGQDKQPIILTNKSTIPTETYSWMKSESLTNAYFIGGPDTLDTEIIHKMADIAKPASGSIYHNRVYGADRHETNAKVIKKFYTKSDLDAVLVARSDKLADALIAGPLAAKLNSPILITPTDKLSEYHEDNLTQKSANVIYQIGGALSDDVLSKIAYKLSMHNAGDKTVVIDPGHGGADPGAVNKVDQSIKEKDYTLDTSLAAAEYLRKNNINVVLTRETDLPSNQKLSLAERSSLSNSINPDLLVSVHFNSYNTVARGIEAFYKYKDRNGGTSKTLASNVLNSVLEKFNLPNRGIKTRVGDDGVTDYYHIIREVNAPAIIIESSFIDNEEDQKLVNTIEKRKLLGTQIGKGIEKTLK